VSGFISAEGCFLVSIAKSPTHKSGFAVQLVLQITQHIRDLKLMENLVIFFGCGNVRMRGDGVDFLSRKFLDNYNIILPFLQKYPIVGVKFQDYED
jgi:hypothetical protein